MMRAVAITVLSITCTFSALGCAEREPLTARDVIAVAPRTERAECAPVAEAVATASAQERRAGTRLRETVSLGYAGDGKLTEIPSSSRHWYEDEHPSIGGYGGYGTIGFGYGHGRSGRGTATSSNGGHTGGSNLIFSPHVHASGGGSRPTGGANPSGGGGGGRPAGGRGPR